MTTLYPIGELRHKALVMYNGYLSEYPNENENAKEFTLESIYLDLLDENEDLDNEIADEILDIIEEYL
jgi:hypothetical protein